MGTNTTKLGLLKPSENDFYNQQTEQADNWEKVDKFADDIQNLVDNNSGKKITGYIQDEGEKVLGNYYLDKLTTGLFKCIKTGNINYNSSDYFYNDSNYALSDKLQNLPLLSKTVTISVSENIFQNIKFREGGISYATLGINKDNIVAINANNVQNGCLETCCLNANGILASYILFGGDQTLTPISVTIFYKR